MRASYKIFIFINISLPLTTIFTERNTFKQIADQYPVNLPPINTIFCGKKKDGIKIIKIKIIPVKKKIEKRKFLIIFWNN